jgi:hypothetical protein
MHHPEEAGRLMSDPGTTQSVPGDEGSTLMDVVAAYARHGFDGNFRTTADARLECGSCRAVLDPAEVPMSSLRRLEGASDPDDMLAVVAVSCPVCGSKGTACLGYGPASSAEDGDVLRGLVDRRGAGGLPANAAPGEVAGGGGGPIGP